MFMKRFMRDLENKKIPEPYSRIQVLWSICKMYEECFDTLHDRRFFNEEDRRVMVAKTRWKIEELCKLQTLEQKKGVDVCQVENALIN